MDLGKEDLFAIELEDIWKRYRVYPKAWDRLKERILKRSYHQEVLGLQGINLKLPKGTSLGIIGDNGAGKTTLLKIIAGITKPTQGFVRVKGSISAILELGMGFYLDFSGRDNIYWNASLLGMSKKEIDECYKDIVSFSELGEFIDHPLKIYSSGMYLRLGFSIAISVNPDILVVDEVLAVGDNHFQKKCANWIDKFMGKGKTLIFCSHNLYLVRQLCEKVIWLDGGKIVDTGNAIEVTDRYLNKKREILDSNNYCNKNDVSEENLEIPRFTYIRICDEFDNPKESFFSGEAMLIEFNFFVPEGFEDESSVGILICRNDKVDVFAVSNEMDGIKAKRLNSKERKITLKFPNLQLLSGKYLVSSFLFDQKGIHLYERRDFANSFSVVHRGKELGICKLEHTWK